MRKRGRCYRRLRGDFVKFLGGAAAYISLDNATHNLRLIRATVPSMAKLMCVIKANAYGHGALRLAKLYEAEGADFFGVATVGEARELRLGGIKLPILILAYTPPDYAVELAELDISQAVFSAEYAAALALAAGRAGVRLKVHIKLDTGMSRIGFSAADSAVADEIYRAVFVPEFIPEGIFTHFSSADIDEREFTLMQYERFTRVCDGLCALGLSGLIRHAANSAAIIDYPQFSLDMVRAGIILYGMAPSDKLVGRLDLRPVMTLRAPISLVKNISRGDSVGYSRKFIADRDMKIATVQIGYADGVFRYAGCGTTTFTVGGRRVKTLGNVCMDQLMLDACSLDVKMGDEVILFGEGGASAEELAGELGTISYELTTTVGERVPRVFCEGGEITDIKF